MNLHYCESPKFRIIIRSRESRCVSKRTCFQLSKIHLFNLWLLRRMCFNPCLSVCLLQFSIQDNGSAKFFQGALHTPNMGEKVAQVGVLCSLLTSAVTWPQEECSCFCPYCLQAVILSFQHIFLYSPQAIWPKYSH
jgi:hypothetical protein